ncbi:BTAD domain-containing putative transcriptional regulator [Streptomyces sp. NPDC000151]|uniref:BTAD domain-containing putative transcriptional regulator n=1 Tax=Streptomyces sp. NPDC000151 TaxID=3154244 RepID=UPI00331FB890
MRFGVLGPLEVWTDERRPVRVPEVKVRTLLADLLAHHGQVVPADRLIEDLWGGSTFTARPTASLQAKVSQLRRALEDAEAGGRDLVTHRAPGYALEVTADTLDSGRFRTLVARARATGNPRARAALFTDALALWRGPAFAEFADQPYVRPAATSLEEDRLIAMEEHAETRLELGEHSLLIGELTGLVDTYPLREGLRAALMRALYQAGRPSEALDCFTDLRRRLGDELGLVPSPALETLQRAILRHDPELARPAPPAQAMTAVPARPAPGAPLSPLVGRDADVERIRTLLSRQRLVTLTGPGGVGKTRLAVATADSLSTAFPDGAWLVELAGIGGPQRGASTESVAEHVMATLGIRESSADDGNAGPAGRLAAALATRHLLLVLDNCEHVVEPVVHLAGLLLSKAPDLHILTTSQEPLRTAAEVIHVVAPLSLPAPGQRGPDAVAASGAVRLFVERATAADPDFVLDVTTAPLVADVCRRLDGIPLALELAATRVRSLGVRELHDRLDDRFRVLNSGYRDAPSRHRTLQATLDWSWSLLETREQTVLRRLSVFAEGCCLEAAEEVCAGGDVTRADVLDVLSVLVERSFALRTEGPSGVRYRLLESVAAYAREKLTESHEYDETAARHLHQCVHLAELARPYLYGREQRGWFLTLDVEAANVQRAVDEALRTGAASLALRLTNALAWYWFVRGRLGEARRMLATALTTAGSASSAERDEAGMWHRGMTLLLGVEGKREGDGPGDATGSGGDVTDPDGDATGRIGVHSSEHDDPADEKSIDRARADWFLAYAQWTVGALADGEQRVERVLREFRALRDVWGTAAALTTRAAFALARGDLEVLRDNALEARTQFAELGDNWGRLKTSEMLSRLAEINGDYDRATQLQRESLRTAETLELWREVSAKLSGLGRVALLRRRYEEAEDLHTRALRLAVEQGDQPAEQFAALGLALGARRQGRHDTAEAWLRPWLAWNRRRGDAPGLALVLAELGFIAEHRGDAERALAHHRDGLAAALTTKDPRSVALALEGLAGAHSLAGHPERAARLLGTAAATRKRTGAPHPPAERGDVERISERVRTALDEPSFTHEFTHGKQTPYETQATLESAGHPHA